MRRLAPLCLLLAACRGILGIDDVHPIDAGGDASISDAGAGDGGDAGGGDGGGDASMLGCGNGRLDTGEQCDNGPLNNDVSGECSASCKQLVEWTRGHDDALSLNDANLAVATGPGGVAVGGYESISLGQTVLWVRKYDSAGAELFTVTKLSPMGNSYAEGVVVHPVTGEVYATGPSDDTGTSAKASTIQIHTNGMSGWTDPYLSAAETRSWAITSDPSGNLIVAGDQGTANNRMGFVRFLAAGTGIQSATIAVQAVKSVSLHAIARNGANTELALGGFDGSDQIHGELVRLTPIGLTSAIWTLDENGVSPGGNLTTAVAFQPSSSVLACGWHIEQSSSWLRRLDTNGISMAPAITWEKSLDVGIGMHRCDGIAVDATGKIYVVNSDGPTEHPVVSLRKLDDTGTQLWLRTFDGELGLGAMGFGVALDPTGAIYLVGQENTNGRGLNGFIRKYLP